MDTRESLIPALSVLAAAVLAAGAAIAGGEQTPAFSNLDTNGDGYIEVREAAVLPGLARHFTALDRNADHRLSKQEYEAYPKLMREGAAQADTPRTKNRG